MKNIVCAVTRRTAHAQIIFWTLLFLPIGGFAGSGAANVYEDMLKEDPGRYEWILELKPPQGLRTKIGNYVDTANLKNGEIIEVMVPLWRKDDAECCATGGHLKVELVFEGEGLNLRKQVYVPPSK